MYDNDFNPELVGGKPEVAQETPVDGAWANMSEEVPYAGEDFTTQAEAEQSADAEESEYDPGVSGAAKLAIALDGISREIGVGATMEGIKNFNPSGVDDVVKALYDYFGIDTKAEKDNVAEENSANKANVADFYNTENAPASMNNSSEEMIKSLQDTKELISEVEGADPVYTHLREGAKGAGKNVWDFAVEKYGVRSLTILLKTLNEERKIHDSSEEPKEDEKDSTDMTEEKLDAGILGGNTEKDNTDGVEKLEDKEGSDEQEDDIVTLNPDIIKIDHIDNKTF